MSAWSRLQTRGAAASATAAPAAPERRPAPRVVMLQPNGFADEWPDKPKTAIPIGIRLVAVQDLHFARSEAGRIACDLHPDARDEKSWNDAFNDTLMQLVVARATCQPDDVGRAFWDVADENVKLALSPAGLAALYEAWEDHRLASDALEPEASDEDLARLGELLADGGVWAELDLGVTGRARRLLRHALGLLGGG